MPVYREMALGHTLLPILPTVESRLIGNSVLVLFTALVVALRIVARLVTGSRLGWDDYLILAAVPQGIGILICQGLCKFSEILCNHVPCYDDRLLIADFVQGPHREPDTPIQRFRRRTYRT